MLKVYGSTQSQRAKNLTKPHWIAYASLAVKPASFATSSSAMISVIMHTQSRSHLHYYMCSSWPAGENTPKPCSTHYAAVGTYHVDWMIDSDKRGNWDPISHTHLGRVAVWKWIPPFGYEENVGEEKISFKWSQMIICHIGVTGLYANM